MLKDNKVPGTSMGTRAAEAPGLGAGSAAGFLGESKAGLCERPGGRISGKEKEKIEAISSCLENFPQQPWPLVPPPPQPLVCDQE